MEVNERSSKVVSMPSAQRIKTRSTSEFTYAIVQLQQRCAENKAYTQAIYDSKDICELARRFVIGDSV